MNASSAESGGVEGPGKSGGLRMVVLLLLEEVRERGGRCCSKRVLLAIDSLTAHSTGEVLWIPDALADRKLATGIRVVRRGGGNGMDAGGEGAEEG